MKMKLISIAVAASLSTLTLTACSGGSSTSTSSNSTSNPIAMSLPSHNSSVYNKSTNGPAYTAIKVSANDILTINSFNIDSNGPVNVVDSTNTKVYGNLTPCTTGLSLQKSEACYIFIHADKHYQQLFQSPGAFHQVLTISTNKGIKYTDIDAQGFLYIGGDFNRLGNANIPALPGHTLLAKCSFPTNINNLSCSNALSGTNHANAGIFALASDNAGNIYIGGRFTQLGNISVTTPGENLLAKYNASTADITNAFNDHGNPANPNFTSNTEIEAISFDNTDNMYITGDITHAGGTSATPGTGIDMQFLVAKCDLTKDSDQCTNSNGDNILKNLSTNYASSNPIYTLGLFTNNTTHYLLAGGAIDQLGGITANYGASCALNSNGVVTNCSEFPGAGAIPANDTIYNILVDNNNRAAYVGGIFTKIDNLNYPSPFLAKCNLSNSGVGTCTNNALGSGAIYMAGGQGVSFITPLVRAVALDNHGNIFIAGKFSTITNGTIHFANASTGNNLIARCPLGSTSTANPCDNLLSAYAPNDGANDIVNSITTNAEITNVSVRVSN